ncbi:hypothetical protein D1007_02165 [Hordeum vulgare]|nr:hypothetical protein D1007_02165 [Hordeum vulgare]
MDAAIDRRRFELDELDLVVASHYLSLATGILLARPAKGHDSTDAAGNKAGQCRRAIGHGRPVRLDTAGVVMGRGRRATDDGARPTSDGASQTGLDATGVAGTTGWRKGRGPPDGGKELFILVL